MLLTALLFMSGLFLSFVFQIQTYFISLGLCLSLAILWSVLVTIKHKAGLPIGLKRSLNLSLIKYGFFMLLGLSWFSSHWVDYSKTLLPAPLENKPLIVAGYLRGLPSQTPYGQRFDFSTQLKCIDQVCKPYRATIRLNAYFPLPPLSFGQPYVFRVTLKNPKPYGDQGVFNQSLYFLQQGLSAKGSVKKVLVLSDLNLKDRANLRLTWPEKGLAKLNNCRLALDKWIAMTLKDQPFQGIIIALVIGNSAGISPSQWAVFQATGTSHLVAISGLHIGLVAALSMWIGTRLARGVNLGLTLLTAQQWGAITGILGALMYTALSGWGIPAQRALIMITVWLGASLLNRFTLPYQRLGLGLWLVLGWNPFSILSIGFWLSFGIIALLAYSTGGRLKKQRGLFAWLKIQSVATLAITPILLVFFQQNSLIGLVANLLAIPFVSWITVPLALLATIGHPLLPSISLIMLKWSEKSLDFLWPFLEVLSHVKGGVFAFAFYHNALVIPFMIGVFILLLPWKVPGKWISVAWILPCFLWGPKPLPMGRVQLTVLDVGQGLSTIIQTAHHVLVYDTGLGQAGGYNLGTLILVPLLRHRHIHHVDTLVISHGDRDHSGGAEGLLAVYHPDTILTSVPELFNGAKSCQEGQHWVWDGVSFEILYPFKRGRISNDNSCVLRIKTGGKAILLTGDISQDAESILIKKYPKALTSTLLLVPHHGSKTSSSFAFIKAVHPAYAIISAGYLNSYHLPSPVITSRYQNLGIQVLNTSGTGQLDCLLDPGIVGLSIKTYYRRIDN